MAIIDDRPTCSKATMDGYYRLLAAILKTAVKDLRDNDPVVSLDALEFIIDDAKMYLDSLGYDLNEDEILMMAVNHGK